jgi:hypothetical protein
MTNRKIAAMLVLAVFAAGWSFAQTDGEYVPDDTKPAVEKMPAPMPMNTITVDFGPTIIGAVIGAAGDIIGEEGLSTSGFGIAAQYERQIVEKFSLGGRFAYLGGGIGLGMGSVEEDGIDVDTSVSTKISSFSIEAHTRFYPWAKTFFLDGMLGYANMAADFSGTVVVSTHGQKGSKTVSFTGSRSYLKLGAKLGWRIDFGKPGGFIFEPSFGYYGGIGLGDTLEKRIADDINKKTGGEIENIDGMDMMFTIMEQFIFVGGPRLALSFGWRF